MKNKAIILTVIAVVSVMAIATLLVGCQTVDMSKQGPDEIKEYGKLVVATSPDFPPFENKVNGEIVGWDIDVAKALAEKLGVELEIQSMEFDSVLASVQTGKAHIGMAGISNTPKRDEMVDFSMNVFDSSQMIIVKADSTIAGPMDLKDKIVAVQAGTIGQYLAEMNEDYAYDFNEDGSVNLDAPILGAPKTVNKLSNGMLAVQQVINGQADAVILDKLPAQKIVDSLNADGVKVKILETSVYDDAYAFAIGEGNKALKEWIDKAYQELVADGTIDEISKKWFE